MCARWTAQLVLRGLAVQAHLEQSPADLAAMAEKFGFVRELFTTSTAEGSPLKEPLDAVEAALRSPADATRQLHSLSFALV